MDNFNIPQFKMPEIRMPEIPKMRNYQFADFQYEILMKSILAYESTLDENQEVAVQLASFGQSVVMQVTKIGYSNPSIIHFYGYVNGNKSELIQHITQLNFMLTSLPKAEPERPTRRIGFQIEEN